MRDWGSGIGGGRERERVDGRGREGGEEGRCFFSNLFLARFSEVAAAHRVEDESHAVVSRP